MEPKLNIEFTATEIQNLGALIDAAIKATGTQGAKVGVPLVEKLEAAVAEYNKTNGAPAVAESEEGHA